MNHKMSRVLSVRIDDSLFTKIKDLEKHGLSRKEIIVKALEQYFYELYTLRKLYTRDFNKEIPEQEYSVLQKHVDMAIGRYSGDSEESLILKKKVGE